MIRQCSGAMLLRFAFGCGPTRCAPVIDPTPALPVLSSVAPGSRSALISATVVRSWALERWHDDRDGADRGAPARGAGDGRARGAPPGPATRDPVGGGRGRSRAGAWAAARPARAAAGAAARPPAADLLRRRRHELARVPLQPAADRPARDWLRGVHHRRGGGGRTRAARRTVGGRVRAGCDHLAARRRRA